MGTASIKWLTDPDSELVFHYTKPATALEHILPSGYIKFGDMCNSNDLYERSLRDISPTAFGEAADGTDSLIEAVTIRQFLHNRSKTFCTINDSNAKHHLGRGYLNFPLWWHYAEKNSGVCIAFDKIKLQNTFKNTTDTIKLDLASQDDVSYDLDSSDVYALFNPSIYDKTNITERMLEHIKRFEKKYFFTKDATWITENEFRFAVICKDDIPFKLDISDSIIGIILGNAFPGCYFPRSSQIMAKFNINAAYIDFHDGKPELFGIKG